MPIESIARVLTARVKDGKLAISLDALRAHLETIGDGEVEVIIRKPRRQRTTDQNRFWRALVDLVAQATGEDHDKTHYDLLGECFGRDWIAVLDEEQDVIGWALVPRVGHSAPLTVEEFTRALEWALYYIPATLGIRIPQHAAEFDLGEGDDDGATAIRDHGQEDAAGDGAAQRRPRRPARRRVAHGESDPGHTPRRRARH